MTKQKKLNLGCGWDKKEEFINCDLHKEVNPDMIVDLEKSLPFKDNEIDYILIDNVLEHITKQIKLINEMWRVCKSGAIILIKVPHYAHCGAWEDLTHKHPFAYRSLNFVCPETLSKKEFYTNASYEYGIARFKIIKRKFLFSRLYRLLGISFFANKHPAIFEQFFAYHFAPHQILFKLEVLK